MANELLTREEVLYGGYLQAGAHVAAEAIEQHEMELLLQQRAIGRMVEREMVGPRRFQMEWAPGPAPIGGNRIPIAIPLQHPVAPSKSAVAVSTLDPGCDEEYQALARDLGVYDAKVVNRDLERFLADNFIEVYPLDSVCKYMNALCEAGREGWASRLVWRWTPLRKQDVTPGPAPLEYSIIGAPQYRKPVPFPVLQTVKTIADRFGEDVRFCVTDVERIPDPFLGVGARLPEGVFQMHVIERWDEPKYRP